MAQALVRYLSAQRTEIDGVELPLVAGMFAIFGHGNVAGLGEALYAARVELPTLRAHNEQAMAHAAIAFAKAYRRRRLLACTTSIGPGATNMVTAAAVAHVNRLPVLLLPGDVFAGRQPDPVLQQVEDFDDPTVTANDCLRPVSRYWDRIVRPEQLMASLPAAIDVLTDPARCGPVTLALPQDVQTEVAEFPAGFFRPRVHRLRRPGPDPSQLAAAAERLRRARRPLVIAGGGVTYSLATDDVRRFVERHDLPVAESQAGKGTLPWDHPCAVGSLGVTGSSAANTLAAEADVILALAAEADVILALGTRLSDFVTGSRALFQHPDLTLIGLNVASFDAAKHGALPLVADVRRGLAELETALGAWRGPDDWISVARQRMAEWNRAVDDATAPTVMALPTDAQVIGAVNRAAGPRSVVVCAAGGLPGELHKLWRATDPESYHLEYGYSCMGYEIAGGLGAKMAMPDREVFVMVGDGSYLMLNSEIATSVTMGLRLVIVVLDNHGFGCINRLQQACGGPPFGNLLTDPVTGAAPTIDFASHARSLGAIAEPVKTIADLEAALERARTARRTSVIVIETDPAVTTAAGGAWWDVAVPAESSRPEVRAARAAYVEARRRQQIGR
jgi:3D-(3,5/4)-trihydroxycyclohexane-1,2-dione acylhydrolase (decyclizing)